MSTRRCALGLGLVVLAACTGTEPPPSEPTAPEPTAPEPIAPEPSAPSEMSAPAPITTPVRPPGDDLTMLHPALTNADLFAFTGDDDALRIAVGAVGTIVRSTDRGATWSVVHSGTHEVLRAAWRERSGAILVVGDAGTVLRSIDAGEHWATVDAGTTGALHHVVGHGDTSWAAGAAGTIVRADDHGVTWTKVAMPALPVVDAPAPREPSRLRPPHDEVPQRPREPTEAEAVRAAYRDDDPVLGLGSSKDGELYVMLRKLLWRTTDGGKTWTVVQRLPASRQELVHLWVGDAGSPRLYVTGRNPHGKTPTSFVGLGRAGERPGFDRWVDVDLRLIGPPIVTAIPRGPGSARVVLAGDGYAVQWSDDDGATWTSSEQSAAMQSPYSLAKRALWVADDGDLFAAGEAGALMHSSRATDVARVWTLLDGGVREPLFGGAITDDGSIYAAVAHAVLRGRDGRWDLLAPATDVDGTPTRRGLVACCTDVWVSPAGAIVAAGGGVLWRSTDGGVRWTEAYTNDRDACCWSLWGDRDAVFGIDRDVVVSSTDAGKTWRSVSVRALLEADDGNRFGLAGRDRDLYAIGARGIVLHSRDRGRTWAREATGTTEYLYGGFVGEDEHGALVAWAVGEHGTLLRSIDRGPWAPVPMPTTARLSAIHGEDGDLVVASGEGLLRSRDGGATWAQLRPEHRSVTSVLGDGRGRMFALGSSGEVLRIEP